MSKLYICKICGKEFKGKSKNPTCCSRTCMNIYKKTNEYRDNLHKRYEELSEEEKTKRKLKHEATMLERYGCKHNWASKDDKINGRGTTKKIYGGVGSGSSIIKEKIAQTKLERYADSNWCNPQKCSETYRNSSKEYKEQVCNARKLGIFNKYGVNSFYETEQYHNLYNNKEWEEHREKAIYLTKKKNNSFNTSKAEIEILNLLKTKFKEVKYQYKSELYPFMCDFYIPSEDLYIEYQGHWTHGFHPFNENNLEDKQKVLLWKNKQDEYYDIAVKTWTIRDPLKRKTVKQNNLKWIEFFTFDEFKSWYDSL